MPLAAARAGGRVAATARVNGGEAARADGRAEAKDKLESVGALKRLNLPAHHQIVSNTECRRLRCRARVRIEFESGRRTLRPS